MVDEWLINLRLKNVLLKRCVWGLTVRPQGMGVMSQVREIQVATEIWFEYKLENLPPVSPGTDKQRLTVTINGAEKPPVIVESAATELTFVAGPVGASVDLKFDYIDVAGNDSGDFTSTFVVVDGIAPAAPIELGTMRQTAEVEVTV